MTDGGFNTENFEPYLNGLFFVQDLSSQMCAEALNLKPKARVLDMCAAPGGKTFSMALLMENKGEIVSCDIHPHRVLLIGNGAKRLGIDIVNPTVCDATQFNENLGKFDFILCDVPCSGFGIIRRKPDIKYKKITDYSELEEIQSKILENSVNYLKENGRKGEFFWYNLRCGGQEASESEHNFGIIDYQYNPKPAYEVIGNDFVSYNEIIRLKGIEDMVERYYNSSSFEKSLAHSYASSLIIFLK